MWYGWFSFLWWSSYICIGIVSPLSLVKTFCRVPSPNVWSPLNDQILNKFHHLVHWNMNEICWTCSKFRIYALYIHLKKKKRYHLAQIPWLSQDTYKFNKIPSGNWTGKWKHNFMTFKAMWNPAVTIKHGSMDTDDVTHMPPHNHARINRYLLSCIARDLVHS